MFNLAVSNTFAVLGNHPLKMCPAYKQASIVSILVTIEEENSEKQQNMNLEQFLFHGYADTFPTRKLRTAIVCDNTQSNGTLTARKMKRIIMSHANC